MTMTRYIVLLMISCGCLFSCRKFITIPSPDDQLSAAKVFNNDIAAQAAMASPYFKLSQIGSFAGGSHASINIVAGLYSDELISYLSNASEGFDFYYNSLTPLNGIVASTWSNCYNNIYECNRIIEGLSSSENVNAELKKQLTGEALFIRGFCHFYLVNLFGDCPLVITSNYAENASIPRAPTSEVYNQIIEDLLQAKELLVDNYPSENRVRVNKGAATALLSRVYLYIHNYVNAEAQSSEIISKQSQYELMEDLNAVFLKTSKEAIWQLLPLGGVRGDKNYTNEAEIFLLKAQPVFYSLQNILYEAFEPNDKRRINWIDSVKSTSGLTTWYFPFKYKQNGINGNSSEYSMVLRLAEQFLIRAEARAEQNKLFGPNSAESDINIIRNRAGKLNTIATSKEQLLLAIEKERRLELFAEWGHRFFDLKRWGLLDKALAPPVKVNWNSTDALLPIPQSERLINLKLTQNSGY